MESRDAEGEEGEKESIVEHGLFRCIIKMRTQCQIAWNSFLACDKLIDRWMKTLNEVEIQCSNSSFQTMLQIQCTVWMSYVLFGALWKWISHALAQYDQPTELIDTDMSTNRAQTHKLGERKIWSSHARVKRLASNDVYNLSQQIGSSDERFRVNFDKWKTFTKINRNSTTTTNECGQDAVHGPNFHS